MLNSRQRENVSEESQVRKKNICSCRDANPGRLDKQGTYFGIFQISVLEPLVEKRISFDRLTYISFHESSFLVATQDGNVVKV